VTSVIAIDGRLREQLPAQARLRVNRLLDIARDAESSFIALIGRTERLREDLSHLRSEQQQAAARARELGSDEAATAAAAQYDEAIREVQSEIDRLASERQKREAKRDDTARLVGALRGWLQDCSIRAQPLAPHQHQPPKLRDNETPMDALPRIRGEIERLGRDLQLLAAAALPIAEMRERARQWVSELASAGRPVLRTAAGAFSIEWMPGAHGGPMAPAGVAVLAATFPDALLAVVEAEIVKVGGTGLSSGERPGREKELRGKLLSLERDEEALVEMALAAGFDVVRRPACNALAVLNLRFGLAVPVAKAS
jgi:hypothetical protein